MSKCVCGKVGMQKCSRCNASYYCSRECQLSDWQIHKSLCSERSDYVCKLADELSKWTKPMKKAVVVRVHSTIDMAINVGVFCNIYHCDTNDGMLYINFTDCRVSRSNTVNPNSKIVPDGHYLYISI